MSATQEELTEKYLVDKIVYKKECSSESEVWVVKNTNLEDNVFSHFSLMDFLHYDLNCVPKSTLMNFAKALKLKILEKITEFEPPDREQLLVLCRITDGSQTERNQNIITRRMLTVVNKQEMFSKSSRKLFDSQRTVSQELTSKLFPKSQKAEKIKNSEVNSYFDASQTNKNSQFNKNGVTEPVAVKIVESHNSEKRISASVEEWVIKTPVCIKDLDKTNNTGGTSQGQSMSKSQSVPKLFPKSDDVHTYVDEWGHKSPPYRKPSTKSSITANKLKEDLTVKSVSSKGVYQESVDKYENSEYTSYKHIFYNKATPHTDYFINTPEEEWDCISSVKKNSYMEIDEINKPHYNYSEEKRRNNLIKVEISNKRGDGGEQHFLSGELINSEKSQYSNSKERKNGCSNFAGRSMQRFFADIRNESGSNRNSGRRPPVRTEESIPGKMRNHPFKVHTCRLRDDESTFGHFSLIDLLNYDVDFMPSDELNNYSCALKLRVLDGISSFEPLHREELEVLCEITDGSQTDRNLKIICSRICALVHKALPNQLLNHKIKPVMPRYQ